MRVSASVSLFDGQELLPALLTNLRTQVDHISVVYQTVSWWAQPAARDLPSRLDALRRRHLVDDVVCYDTGPASRGEIKRHEADKRSLGLELACARGATHVMSLDVDEFYRTSDVECAKDTIRNHGYDVTVVRVCDYHARPIYRRTALATYQGIDVYVPFICEVRDGVCFDVAVDFPWPVDPSRRLACRNPYSFDPASVVMHHMTTVRGSVESLVSKFVNSASRSPFQFEDPRRLAEHVWHFDPGRDRAPCVSIVPDEFGIDPLAS